MNRRAVKGLLFLVGLVPALVLAAEVASSAPAPAAAVSWKEGVNYERLPIAIETRDPAKVEVIEVFSYACIHCKHFQPMIEAWHAKAPEDVDFYPLPAAFDPTWAAMAQLFYTAEALGVTDKVHDLIFSAIHDRQVNLADPAEAATLFKDAAGVAPERFNQVYTSFSVRSRVQQADARTRAYRVNGTPSMVVDGRFRVDARMAGGNEQMLQVVDYLVEQQRALHGKSAE